MDFRSEIENYTLNIQSKLESELKKIQALQATIIDIEEKIFLLRTSITEFKKQYQEQLSEIVVKKELIAQWREAVEEHTIALKTNEALLDAYVGLSSTQQIITTTLANLEKQKTAIRDSIVQFHQDNPYLDAKIAGNLQDELTEKNQALAAIITNIEEISRIESRLPFLIQAFLQLLRSWDWISDPQATEQIKLTHLSEEIAQISESLQQYQSKTTELEALHQQEQDLSAKETAILEDKQDLARIEAIKQDISESKQTIKQLNTKIRETESECARITRKINYASFQKTMANQQALLQEKEVKTRLLQEKSLDLTQIENPQRVALRTELKNKLLETLSQQKSAEERGLKTKADNKFFKTLAQESQATSHFVALTRIQSAIKTFCRGLPSKNQEYQCLEALYNKLLLWQTKEDMAQQSQSIDDRLAAHDELNLEITGLIQTLPIDNPLHAALNYIASLTLPIQVEPRKTKGLQ